MSGREGRVRGSMFEPVFSLHPRNAVAQDERVLPLPPRRPGGVDAWTSFAYAHGSPRVATTRGEEAGPAIRPINPRRDSQAKIASPSVRRPAGGARHRLADRATPTVALHLFSPCPLRSAAAKSAHSVARVGGDSKA